MKNLKQKIKQNVAATKLWVLASFIVIQLILLTGTFLAPDRKLIPDSRLVTSQTFPDDSGSVQITSQTIDKKNHIMKLEIRTSDDVSMDKLKTNIFIKNSSQSTMQFIPIMDNKATIFIKGISNDFEVLALAFQNNSLLSKDVDINIFDNKDESLSMERAQSDDSEQPNISYFFITQNSKYLKVAKEEIKIQSQAAYAIEAIQEEIDFQSKQDKKMDAAILALEKSQLEEQARIDELKIKNDYLTGNALNSNQNSISRLESNISSDIQKTEQANQNKQTIAAKIEKMKQQISDIESGKFKFTDDVKSQKLK